MSPSSSNPSLPRQPREWVATAARPNCTLLAWFKRILMEDLRDLCWAFPWYCQIFPNPRKAQEGLLLCLLLSLESTGQRFHESSREGEVGGRTSSRPSSTGPCSPWGPRGWTLNLSAGVSQTTAGVWRDWGSHCCAEGAGKWLTLWWVCALCGLNPQPRVCQACPWPCRFCCCPFVSALIHFYSGKVTYVRDWRVPVKLCLQPVPDFYFDIFKGFNLAVLENNYFFFSFKYMKVGEGSRRERSISLQLIVFVLLFMNMVHPFFFSSF